MAEKKSEPQYTVSNGTGHTVIVTGEARRDVFLARGYKSASAKFEATEKASEPAKSTKAS
ncbi:MAG: hypothetical protein ABIN55_02940 [Aeromicrobium sp.]